MKRIIQLNVLFFGGIVLFIIILLGAFAGNQDSCQSTTSSNYNVTTSADKEAVAKSLHDNLKQAGYSEAGIAGYLGNTEHESGFDSGVVQGHKAFDESTAMNSGLSGYAIGLNQWDSGRRVNLLNFAKEQGKEWKDGSMQLDFALNHDGSDSNVLKQGLAMNDVADATEFLRSKWERGGVGTTAERTAKAQNWYGKFSGGSDSSAVSTAVSGSESSDNSEQVSNNDSSCKTDVAEGMAQSGVPVKEIPASYKDKITNTNFTAHSSSNTYPFGQCTYYVYDRMQQLGTPVENYLGNGADWGANAKAKGYETSNTPHAGWAVSFTQGAAGADPTYGHIAVVEAISDDGQHFLVSEANVVASGTGTVSFRELTNGAGMVYIKGK